MTLFHTASDKLPASLPVALLRWWIPAILCVMERVTPLARAYHGLVGRIRRATEQGIPFGKPFAAVVRRCRGGRGREHQRQDDGVRNGLALGRERGARDRRRGRHDHGGRRLDRPLAADEPGLGPDEPSLGPEGPGHHVGAGC